MDVAAGSNIETLGIRTELVDNEIAAQQLQQLGATGEATAQRIATAGQKASQTFSQSFIQESAKARAAAQNYATQFEQQFASDQARIKEGIARGFLSPAEARTAGKEAAQAYNQGLLSQLDALGKTGLNAGNSQTYRDLATSIKAVDGASAGAHVNIGRLGQELTSVTRRALELNPAIGQFGYLIGQFALGGVTTVAILAGVAAIGLAYESLTEKSRKAKEEQQKLTTALDEWYAKQQQGAAGELSAQIDAMIAKIRQLRAELDPQKTGGNAPLFVQLKAQLAGLFAGGDPVAQASAIVQSIDKWYYEQTKAVEHGAAALEAAIKEANAKVGRAIQEAQEKEISGLAAVISQGRATPTQATLGQSLVADYQRQLERAQRAAPPPSAGAAFRENLEQQADLLAKITAITGAFTTAEEKAVEVLKTRLEAVQRDNAASAAATIEYNRQAVAVGKLTAETQASFQAIRDRIALIGAEGIEHDRLANHLDFEAQRRKLTNDIIAAGTLEEAQALIVRREGLTKLEELTDRYIVLSTATKYAKEAQEGLNQAVRNLKPATIPKPDTAVADEAMKQFEHAIYRDLSSAIADSLHSGLDSFRAFVTEAERLIEKLAGDIAAKKIVDLLKGSGGAATLEKLIGPAAVIAGSASLAYSYGAGNTNRQSATVLPTLMGLGAAGPGGALLGFTASLLGFNNATKDAKKQIEDFHKAFDTAFNAFRDEASGVATDLTRALAANAQQAEAFRQQTESALAGKRKQTEREKELDAITAAEAENAARIARDFWTNIDQAINALSGPAGAYANQIAAIEKAYQENLRSADAAAKALGRASASDEERAKILELETKALELAKAAEAERLAQLQFSLDAREAYAKGLTEEGKAIERKAQEDKEIFDAQQAHYTDAQIAQLEYIQSLEDAAAAAEKAAAVQRQQEDLNVRILRAQGFNAQADQAAFAYQQAHELDDALKSHMDPNTLAMLQLAQSLEADAFAAEQLRQAMQTARSDIARDVQLGFTTPQAAIEQERQALGFGGLTNEQIRAQYTPYTGTPLTPGQEATNALVTQFFQDLAQFMGTGGVAQNATRTSAGSTQAVTYAAEALTEVTGNRMADYLDTIAVYVREIVGILRGGSRVASAAVANAALSPAGGTQSVAASSLAPIQPLNLASSQSVTGAVPLFQPQPILPQATGGASSDALQQWFTGKTAPKPSTPAVAPVINVTLSNISVSVNITEPVPDGLALARDIGDVSARQIAKKLAPSLNLELARLAMNQRLRDGDPTKAG